MYSLPESQNLSKLVPAVTWIKLSIKFVILHRQRKRNPGQTLPWPATGIPWKKFDKQGNLLSWSVLTTIGSLAGPSPFTVDANTVIL